MSLLNNVNTVICPAGQVQRYKLLWLENYCIYIKGWVKHPLKNFKSVDFFSFRGIKEYN